MPYISTLRPCLVHPKNQKNFCQPAAAEDECLLELFDAYLAWLKAKLIGLPLSMSARTSGVHHKFAEQPRSLSVARTMKVLFA